MKLTISFLEIDGLKPAFIAEGSFEDGKRREYVQNPERAGSKEIALTQLFAEILYDYKNQRTLS